MEFGDKLTALRKEKGLTREELGKFIGTSGAIIGRYERNDMKPSIDIAAKLALALDASLDYLMGIAAVMVKDKKTLERLESINNLPEDHKNELFNVIDALLRDYKAKQTYAS